MPETQSRPSGSAPAYAELARMVLVAFLLTFMGARIIVFLVMSRAIPDLYLHVGGTHVHHLNYGIVLLSVIGGYLLFARPTGRKRRAAALVYGIAMGLTFDEFGMWIHLGGSYWQRASWDGITVVGAILVLIAFASSLQRFRPRHWFTAVAMLLVLIVFLSLFVRSFRYAGRKLGPTLHQLESTAPR